MKRHLITISAIAGILTLSPILSLFFITAMDHSLGDGKASGAEIRAAWNLTFVFIISAGIAFFVRTKANFAISFIKLSGLSIALIIVAASLQPSTSESFQTGTSMIFWKSNLVGIATILPMIVAVAIFGPNFYKSK